MKYRSQRYGAATRIVIAVITTPLRLSSQKLIGSPARSAMPIATTFALAPTAVALPPKSALAASAHPQRLGVRRIAEVLGEYIASRLKEDPSAAVGRRGHTATFMMTSNLHTSAL